MSKYTAAVLTVSDSVSRGLRKDLSGPAAQERLEQYGFTVVASEVVPDEQAQIEQAIIRLCAAARLVVTTGGTGLGPRDVTPEATRAVAGRVVDGIAERIRTEGARKIPTAILSRGVCAARGSSLILNLPGSPSAATESLDAVAQVLTHALDLLAGNTSHGA